MKQFRASSMPLAFACPGSQYGEDEIKIDTANPAADLGLATHAVLRDLVASGSDQLPEDLTEYADRFDLPDTDELRMLVFFGLRALGEIRAGIKGEILVEVELASESLDPPAILTGHLDAYAPGNEIAILLDYKSGRLDLNHYHQFASYAWLAWNDGNADKIVVYAILLRDQTYRKYTFTPAKMAAWWQEFQERIVRWDGKFTVGGHCRFCPRQAACPARTAMVRSTVTELLDLANPAVDPAVTTREEYAATRKELAWRNLDLFRRVKVIESAVEQFKDWLKADISLNGPMTVGDVTLQLDQRERQTIDAEKAWPILTARLTDDDLAPAVTISKGKLLDTIASYAQRGQKGKARQEIMELLRAAEAITTKTYDVLTEARD